MRKLAITVVFAVSAVSAMAEPPTPIELSAADQGAAFRAAGFALESKQWHRCDDPGTASYSPGAIEAVRDLNGDGLPEAVISEGSTFCFGHTGMGYALVTKRSDGRWALMDQGTGIPSFLATRGVGNWPDMQVGGPGFCFPVLRWDGRKYAPHRFEYEGKRCTPPQ